MRRLILFVHGAICLLGTLVGPLAAKDTSQSGAYSFSSDSEQSDSGDKEQSIASGMGRLDDSPRYDEGASQCGGGCGLGSMPCYHTCPGWTAGYEHTFMKPHFSVPFGVSPSVTTGSALVFEPPLATFDYDSAPRAWVGYVGCQGLGFRARYWGFDQAANEAVFIDFPQLGLNTFTTGSLSAHEVDIEATQEACFCSWLFNVSGGVRLAHTDLRSHVTINNGITIDLFDHRHEFDGVGPTFALEAIRPICGSNFALFGNGRCSLVFGNTNSDTTVIDDQGIPTTFDSSTEAMLSILELQVGAQWSCYVGCGSRLFVRGAFEGQVWNDAGNLYTTDSDLGFLGFAVGVGLMR